MYLSVCWAVSCDPSHSPSSLRFASFRFFCPFLIPPLSFPFSLFPFILSLFASHACAWRRGFSRMWHRQWQVVAAATNSSNGLIKNNNLPFYLPWAWALWFPLTFNVLVLESGGFAVWSRNLYIQILKCLNWWLVPVVSISVTRPAAVSSPGSYYHLFLRFLYFNLFLNTEPSLQAFVHFLLLFLFSFLSNISISTLGIACLLLILQRRLEHLFLDSRSIGVLLQVMQH